MLAPLAEPVDRDGGDGLGGDLVCRGGVAALGPGEADPGVSPRRQLLAFGRPFAPFFLDALILGQSDPINFALVAWGLLAVEGGAREFVGSGLIGMAGDDQDPAGRPLGDGPRPLAIDSASSRGSRATIVAGFALVAVAGVGPGGGDPRFLKTRPLDQCA